MSLAETSEGLPGARGCVRLGTMQSQSKVDSFGVSPGWNIVLGFLSPETSVRQLLHWNLVQSVVG